MQTTGASLSIVTSISIVTSRSIVTSLIPKVPGKFGFSCHFMIFKVTKVFWKSSTPQVNNKYSYLKLYKNKYALRCHELYIHKIYLH